MYIPYTDNYKLLASKFAQGIEAAAASLEHEAINDHLKFQIKYTNKYYNWNKQGVAWTRFLQGAINAKQ
jgi:hypothetical protein